MNTDKPVSGNTEEDQQKAFTPDKTRNDAARWKDKDMPDQGSGKGEVSPDDYEKPPTPR
ncbi:MAG: hypothetical protein ACK4FW_00790 [Stenotrophomonas sp.]